jgi:hypothetical protein
MTPDELRQENPITTPNGLRAYAEAGISLGPNMLLAAADAWKKLQNEYDGLADIADGFYKRVNDWVAENDELSGRLKAAEKVREAVTQDIANGHMRGTMPLTIAALVGEETITDGYQVWPKRCAMCGKDTMSIVRPGKVQCEECG